MSPPRPKKRDRSTLRTALALVAAYALPIVLNRTHVFGWVDMLLWRSDPGLDSLFWMAYQVIAPAFVAALTVATVGIALGFLVRTVARARVRAGLADPLERARAFAAGRSPARAHVLAAAPALAWVALNARHYAHVAADQSPYALLPGIVLPAAVALLAHVVLARRGLRALLAPTLDEHEAASEEAQAEGFTFDAVAVTRETRGAVGGLAAVSAAMALAMVLLPVSSMRSPSFVAALAAYVALTAGAAALFRRASRVSIGLDGVLVRGSSRTRFYGFRDVDRARVRGGDLELLRGERVVVRLQLHGKDAARRDALLTRLEAAIARARAERDEPAVSFVSGATRADMTRAAEGGGDYRQPAVSREQLWSVLEGPAIDTAARRAAAEALAGSRDPAERARLRVAAEHCAEPAVRARMQELLDDDASDALPPLERALPLPIAR
ncbi:MAG TPA: hypothetical protein VLT33_23420 [Labilithrix sp.]|nr:hypothetical protein [Labilithrix sp.]